MSIKNIALPLTLLCFTGAPVSLAECQAIQSRVQNPLIVQQAVLRKRNGTYGAIAVAGRSKGISLSSVNSTLQYNPKADSFIPGSDYDFSDDVTASTMRITASTTDKENPLKGVSWKIMFSNPYIGGKASDYVKITPVTSDGLTVQINLLKPFSHEIRLVATSTENPNVTGSILVNYVKRISRMNVSFGVKNGTKNFVNLDSENDFAFITSAVTGFGTLTPSFEYKYYFKFSQDFSDTTDFVEVNREMSGPELRALLQEHAKSETAIDELLNSENGNGGKVALYATATVTYEGEVYQFLTSEAIYPKFTVEDELRSSVGEIDLNDVNGESSTIVLEGGAGEYTVSVSESLEGVVTPTLDGNTLTLEYNYSSNVSGEITIVSGEQSIVIPVNLESPVVECLTGDTLITLDDLTTKRIDQIEPTDKVLSVNPETGEYESDYITFTDAKQHKTYNHYDRFVFDDGTVLKVVHRHRFYNVEDQRMIHIDRFQLGDRAYKIDGTTPKLVEAVQHYEDVETKHYTIFTGNQNYFANGLLSGNHNTKPMQLGEKEVGV